MSTPTAVIAGRLGAARTQIQQEEREYIVEVYIQVHSRPIYAGERERFDTENPS